jgi:hypothetical protein
MFRVNINEFFFNNFFFYWIQFFILPTFIFFIVYYYFIFFLKYKNINNYLFTALALLLMFVWINEYYFLNNIQTKPVNTPFLFNNLLFNSLNKYHPVLFFLSYLYIYKTTGFINCYSNYMTNNPTNFTYKINYKWIFIKNINLLWVLILISLYLGSWWAIQEGSWGGWWNWDASEVFGLIILTFYIYVLHLYSPYSKIHTIIIISWITSLIVLILYCILQMSYTLVSHNFGLNMLDYGYVNFTLNTYLLMFLGLYSYIQLLSLNFLIIEHLYIRTLLLIFINLNRRKKNKTNFFKYILLFLLFIYI